MSSDSQQSQDGDEAKQPLKLSIEAAINELDATIANLSDIYHQLKEVKYNYLVRTCELLGRIDFPSIMLEAVRKEIKQVTPSAKSIGKM